MTPYEPRATYGTVALMGATAAYGQDAFVVNRFEDQSIPAVLITDFQPGDRPTDPFGSGEVEIEANLLRASGDRCEAVIVAGLVADLTGLGDAWREAYQPDSGQIILNLNAIEHPITYTV